MEDHAESLSLPNNQNPRPFKPAYYGNRNVPHRTNEAAKKVHPEEIMRAVNEGK